MGRIIACGLIVGLTAFAAVSPDAGLAAGVPDRSLCADAATLKAADNAVQGGCIALDRHKGNCNACHQIVGVASGNIAPPLAFMADRFPDAARLRAQIDDPRRFNRNSVMPPFGAHRILTPDEIDKVVQFLLTL